MPMLDKWTLCFRALSSKNRLKIFLALRECDDKKDVSDLVKLTGLKQPTVTFHVNQLTKAGLVKKEKRGRNVYCRTVSLDKTFPVFLKDEREESL